MLPSCLMVLKFCSDLSKKSKSIKAIYIYASEKSRYELSKIDVFFIFFYLKIVKKFFDVVPSLVHSGL